MLTDKELMVGLTELSYKPGVRAIHVLGCSRKDFTAFIRRQLNPLVRSSSSRNVDPWTGKVTETDPRDKDGWPPEGGEWVEVTWRGISLVFHPGPRDALAAEFTLVDGEL